MLQLLQSLLLSTELGNGDCFFSGDSEFFSEFGAGVIGEEFYIHAEDNVTDPENANGGRIFCDFDLAGVGGHHLVAEDPAASSGCAEIPVVVGP